MTETLQGRIAMVTGGGGGLGAAICSVLAEAGCRIIVGDIRAECADEVVKQLTSRGQEAIGVGLDVMTRGASRRPWLAPSTTLAVSISWSTTPASTRPCLSRSWGQRTGGASST
jgi:NAD(P)-dependent dehydrogenase (short-subunit alcohol dehydrogenase family)